MKLSIRCGRDERPEPRQNQPQPQSQPVAPTAEQRAPFIPACPTCGAEMPFLLESRSPCCAVYVANFWTCAGA